MQSESQRGGVQLYRLTFFRPIYLENTAFLIAGNKNTLMGVLGHYRPQRSCGQGYVFTRVCDSVNGGVSREPPPQDQADPPPPGPRRTPPPRTKENTPPAGRPPPDQAETPPPGRGLQHTVNERPVRILLECILVMFCKGMCKKVNSPGIEQ